MNPPSSIRHYLQSKDFSLEEYEYLLDRSAILKVKLKNYKVWHPPYDHTLTMIFEKSSTRTRLLFEAGVHQPGGHAVFLNARDSQLERGGPIENAAQVISRMTDIITTHIFGQEIIKRFAAYPCVPVINGLTNEYHPCQVLADIFIFIEQRDPVKGKTVTQMGDANNMIYTWIQAAEILGFHFHFSAPGGYQLDPAMVANSALPFVYVLEGPLETYDGAHLVTTDVWTNMGYEVENEARKKAFGDWMVIEATTQRARPDALFIHCLSAHRDEEVEVAVIDGKQSAIWDEAENRLHVQKALMEYLLYDRY